jgi:hypothetical protein
VLEWGQWEAVIPIVFLWSPPHVFAVVRCNHCTHADVWVRFPERLNFCERCGAVALANRAGDRRALTLH